MKSPAMHATAYSRIASCFSLASLAAILCLLPMSGISPAADASEEAAMKTLSIFLRGNPSTGYLWNWTADGDGEIREENVAYKQDVEDLPGSPATFTYTFVGVKAGEVTLRFVYSRSWEETPSDSVNIYRLKVLPDNRIVLLDTEEEIAK